MMYGWAACHKCQNWLPSVAIKLSLAPVIGTHLHNVAIRRPGVQGPIILNPSLTVRLTHTVLTTAVHQAWAIRACGAGHVA